MIEPWKTKLPRYAEQLGCRELVPLIEPDAGPVGSIVPPVKGYTEIPIGVVESGDYITLISKVFPSSRHPGLRDSSVQSRLLELINDYQAEFAGARPYLDRTTGDINSVTDLPADSISSAEHCGQYLKRHSDESVNIISYLTDHLIDEGVKLK